MDNCTVMYNEGYGVYLYPRITEEVHVYGGCVIKDNVAGNLTLGDNTTVTFN